jgi:hypothetical protein
MKKLISCLNGVRKGKGKLLVTDSNLSVKVSTTYFGGNNGPPIAKSDCFNIRGGISSVAENESAKINRRAK